MHYLALACDYDGTLAKDGVVGPQTITALERVKASGRKLILVTGRLLEDLQKVFPRLDLFTSVVAENGALLYYPADATEQLLGKTPPQPFLQALTAPATPDHNEGSVWFRRTQQPPQRIRLAQPREQHQRHRRKYAEGNLGEDISFYFRGPEGKLQLRAQNLTLFAQMAEGVDEQTWLFHLHQGDYSHWFREVIKDTDLATEAEEIEQNKQLSASESRSRMIAAIEHHYTQST